MCFNLALEWIVAMEIPVTFAHAGRARQQARDVAPVPECPCDDRKPWLDMLSFLVGRPSDSAGHTAYVLRR